MDACRAAHPIRLPPSMEEIQTPLKWEEWDHSLANHTDQRFRKYIVEGIRFGFRVGFDYSFASRTRNFSTECAEGRVLGPLDPSQFPLIHTSRFGVIPKGSTDKWRLIVDMSAPEGASINDGISKALGTLTYVGINEAAQSIRTLGRGSLLAKVDVRSAYRNIPVHPEDRWLMGMLWDGGLFVDTTLPFGLRSAPKIFTAVADAVEWIARHERVNCVIHYLDDFLVIGAPASQECASALSKLLEIFERLGFPVAIEKLEGPTTCLEFLGFEADSAAMVIRLPARKLVERRELLRQWQGKKVCTRRELESVVGKLSHAAQVVVPGRTFLRRLFELLRGVRQPHHRIHLSQAARSDFQWWQSFIGAWNGVRLIRQPLGSQQPVHVWTDASGHFGCGGLEPESKAWFQLRWPASYRAGWVRLKEESIALPIVLACALWGGRWTNQLVKVHCDNLGVVALVNSGYS